MSATPSELELLARRNDRMMDKAVAIYRRRLQGLQQRIMEEIRASRLPDSRLAISLNSYQAIEQMLARAGFSTFYEFQDLLEESALESVSQLSDAIGDPDILAASRAGITEAVTATSNDLQRQVRELGNGIVNAIKAEVEVATVIPRPLAGMAANISSATGLAQSRALTLVNTALASVQRNVQARAMDRLVAAGQEVFVYYTGPLDDKTRPFCRPLVGKAISRDQMAKLSPGRGLNFRQNGGGYNCRHTLIPVTASWVTATDTEKAKQKDIAQANRGAKR